jgi:hypothetical protein
MLDDQSYNETELEPCSEEDTTYALYILDYDFAQKGANTNNSACMGKTVLIYKEIKTALFLKNLVLLHDLTTTIVYVVISAPCTTISYDVTALQFIQDPMNVWLNYNGDENESSNESSTGIEDGESHNDTTLQQDSEYETEATAEEGNSTYGTNSSSESDSQLRYVYLYYTTADEMTYSSDLMIDFPGFISATGGNLGIFLGFSFMGMLFSLYEWMEARFLNRNIGRGTKVQNSNADFTK